MPFSAVWTTLRFGHRHAPTNVVAAPEAAAAPGPAPPAELAALRHELRNALFALSAYVELLGHDDYGPLTAAQRDLLWRMRHSTQELERLLTVVLPAAVAR